VFPLLVLSKEKHEVVTRDKELSNPGQKMKDLPGDKD
jgi:hypothetical protein